MKRGARFQSTLDQAKALEQYEAMRPQVVRALVIAELKDGNFHILAQNMKPNDAAPLLMVAADFLARVEANRRLMKLVARQEPVQRGEWNQSKPMPKAIKTGPDGVLTPPLGENFISCGECIHPQWFVLHHNANDLQSRIACSHCGNEVVMLPIEHTDQSREN